MPSAHPAEFPARGRVALPRDRCARTCARGRAGARPSRTGYALLEASTALFIAVTGLFGALQIFQRGVDTIRVVSEFATAGRIIQNELETLRAQPFDALEPANGAPFRSASPELDRLPAARVYTQIVPDAALPARLKQVTLVVRWRTEHGRPVERRLTTLVARRGAP